MIPYYGLILWTGILYGGIKHVRLKDKKKTFVCLAFLSTVLLQSLRAEYVDGTVSSGIYSQCPGRMARSRF